LQTQELNPAAAQAFCKVISGSIILQRAIQDSDSRREHAMTPPFNKSELTILVFMRIMGIGGMLAVPAIFFPYSWMNSIHQFMGMGTMPDAPIVSYLARSLSAFYAVLGSFTFYISLDIRRHRSLVRLWALMVSLLSIVILGIDVTSGMPLSWTLSEGPPTFAVGLTLLWCQRNINSSSAGSADDACGRSVGDKADEDDAAVTGGASPED